MAWNLDIMAASWYPFGCNLRAFNGGKVSSASAFYLGYMFTSKTNRDFLETLATLFMTPFGA